MPTWYLALDSGLSGDSPAANCTGESDGPEVDQNILRENVCLNAPSVMVALFQETFPKIQNPEKYPGPRAFYSLPRVPVIRG